MFTLLFDRLHTVVCVKTEGSQCHWLWVFVYPTTQTKAHSHTYILNFTRRGNQRNNTLSTIQLHYRTCWDIVQVAELWISLSKEWQTMKQKGYEKSIYWFKRSGMIRHVWSGSVTTAKKKKKATLCPAKLLKTQELHPSPIRAVMKQPLLTTFDSKHLSPCTTFYFHRLLSARMNDTYLRCVVVS